MAALFVCYIALYIPPLTGCIWASSWEAQWRDKACSTWVLPSEGVVNSDQYVGDEATTIRCLVVETPCYNKYPHPLGIIIGVEKYVLFEIPQN